MKTPLHALLDIHEACQRPPLGATRMRSPDLEIFHLQLKRFIGKEKRSSKVEHASKTEASGIPTFYMGKNTPERKDYIMENLVVSVED